MRHEARRQDDGRPGRPALNMGVRATAPAAGAASPVVGDLESTRNGHGRRSTIQRRQLVLNDTWASPPTPMAFAAAGLRSITRPFTNGPRSLIRTITDRPVWRLVTRTFVPKGRLGCAAVLRPGFETPG